MSILSDFREFLISGTAHRLAVDSDPSSETYGDEVAGDGFTVGFTQMSGRQVRELGMEVTTRAYSVYADRDAVAALAVNPKERLRIDERGDFDVLTVQSVEDQIGFDGLIFQVESID